MPDAPAKKTVAKKAAASKTASEPTVWGRLAADFPADWIEKLPKTVRRDDDDKGQCREGSRYSADGHYCGKYHARAVHLDYVGHAGITMRLNDVLGVGGWDFQPMALTPDGLPILSRDVFYGKLTIRVGDETVTKWDMAANYKSPQEAYGDCLRRCAMRFGVGTYLWSKSEQALERARHASDEPDPEPASAPHGGQQRQEQGQRGPEPAPMTPHGQATFTLLQGLSEQERYVFRPWWEREQQQGNLPPLAYSADVTEAQASWVAEVVQNMRDRAREEAARVAAAEAAQEQAQEDQPLPDPQ